MLAVWLLKGLERKEKKKKKKLKKEHKRREGLSVGGRES